MKFLEFPKNFCNKRGVRVSIFGEQFESSKIVPKSVAMHPQALISHFNPIINHKPPLKIPYELQNKSGKSLKLFAVFFLYRPRFLGPIDPLPFRKGFREAYR